MLQLEKDVLIYLNLFEATWGFLWKKKKKNQSHFKKGNEFFMV